MHFFSPEFEKSTCVLYVAARMPRRNELGSYILTWLEGGLVRVKPKEWTWGCWAVPVEGKGRTTSRSKENRRGGCSPLGHLPDGALDTCVCPEVEHILHFKEGWWDYGFASKNADAMAIAVYVWLPLPLVSNPIYTGHSHRQAGRRPFPLSCLWPVVPLPCQASLPHA